MVLPERESAGFSHVEEVKVAVASIPDLILMKRMSIEHAVAPGTEGLRRHRSFVGSGSDPQQAAQQPPLKYGLCLGGKGALGPCLAQQVRHRKDSRIR